MVNNGSTAREALTRSRASRCIAWGIALAGVALSLLLWRARLQWERNAAAEAFRARTAQLVGAIEREVDLFAEVLESLGRLHGVSAQIDEAAFEEFVEKGLVYHRHILSTFGWAPRVRQAERALYERAMQQRRGRAFRVEERDDKGALRAAGAREVYYPASYIESDDEGILPVGLDLAASESNRKALEVCRATGAAASGDTLNADAVHGSARLVFYPIFSPGGTSDEVTMSGVVFALLDPKHVLQRTFTSTPPGGIEVFVFDHEADREHTMLYALKAGPGLPPVSADSVNEQRDFVSRHLVRAAGQTWLLLCRPSPAFLETHYTRQPWILLGAGLVFTGLLTAHLLVLAGRAEKIEHTVEERTRELKRTMEDRTRLQTELLEISNREKRRMGQDLHDSLGQQLTGVGYLCRALSRKLRRTDPEQAAEAEHLNTLINESIVQAKRIARGLFPVEMTEEGLVAALKRLAEDSAAMYPVKCTFSAGKDCLVYDNEVALNLYHIAQEAVHNAVRHAAPGKVTIHLSKDGAAGELSIEDDGRGFTVAGTSSGGMGLQIMRYRAERVGGGLEVDSEEGRGTRIICRFEDSNEGHRGEGFAQGRQA